MTGRSGLALLYRVTRTLGGMTAKELGRRMDMEELVGWSVFFDLEAEGAIQQDLRATVEHQLSNARLG